MSQNSSPDISLEVLADQQWRLRNLYKIKDKNGDVSLFEPNWAQQVLADPHYLNIVLKARQLGVTTYHALLFLDTCLFNRNVNAAIIADSKNIAREIFLDKVKFAYDHLPEFVRSMCHAYRDNVNEMRFSNGSVFRVATSLRGGTLQMLHITEFAKICQDNPQKANEIVSGALNAVQSGQFVCIESTARGREGHFYNLCKAAQELEDAGAELSPLDWRLVFFPWWKADEYTLSIGEAENTILTRESENYFKSLEDEHNIYLTPEQKAWYVKKAVAQGEYMMREYPSTIDEAFQSANEGFYFAKQMAVARQEKRICHLPYDEMAKTFTSWDIGISDTTAIWVWQLCGKEVHCIDYYENNDEAVSHYIRWLKSKPYMYDCHYLPHDAGSRAQATGKTYADFVRESGFKVVVLKRDHNELIGIESLRRMLPRFFFDYQKCTPGIKALENFRKEWNEKLGCYRERSLHNHASHASKSMIYAAEAIERHMGGTGMSAEQWRQMRSEWI